MGPAGESVSTGALAGVWWSGLDRFEEPVPIDDRGPLGFESREPAWGTRHDDIEGNPVQDLGAPVAEPDQPAFAQESLQSLA
jgi:hypothetical protein